MSVKLMLYFLDFTKNKNIFNFCGTHLYLAQAGQLGLAEKFWGEINLMKQ